MTRKELSMKNVHKVYHGRKTKDMHFFSILYCFLPLVDMVNGFVIQELHSNFSVGQIYRFLLIAIILLLIISYKKMIFRDIVPLAWIAFTITIWGLLHVLMGRNLLNEFTNGLQWILFPMYVFGFSLLKAHGQMCEGDRRKILEIWQWLFSLTILVPKLLGIGYSTYGNEIGYKGFYYANNGVSFALSILVIYSLYKLYSELSLLNGIKFVLCAWTCMILGTKSALFAIVVAVVFLLFDKWKKKYFQSLIFIFLALIIAYFLFQPFIEAQINDVLKRYNYIMRIQNNDFIDSITSGRIGKIDKLWTEMKNGGVLSYVFGLGNINYVAEMDFIDLFFQYGILGILVVIMYIILVRKDTLKVASIYRRLFVFSIAYAFVVGHVFNNAMSTMIISLIFVSISENA